MRILAALAAAPLILAGVAGQAVAEEVAPTTSDTSTTEVQEDAAEVIVVNRPEAVKDCKEGGWEVHGYKNQGRCVSDVRKHNNEQRKAEKAELRAAAKAAKAAAKGAKVTAKGKK